MSEPDIKTVRTSQLNIAFEEHGPSAGSVVLLLHGWPDDPRTWDAIVPQLARDGYRVLVPYVRGFGPTRFLSTDTMRSGQYTGVARDAVDFLTALHVSRAIIVGHDWGCRAGYVMAAAWPDRVERLIAISVGYDAITDPAELDAAQVRQYWYQWYMMHDGGANSFTRSRRELCRELWRVWSPNWHFDDTTFRRTAEAWDNPDWVDITIQSYRFRWRATAGDDRYADLESLMSGQPQITIPTTMLHGASDGANLVGGSTAKERFFTGGYSREVLPGIGHFVQREAPESVLDAIRNPL